MNCCGLVILPVYVLYDVYYITSNADPNDRIEGVRKGIRPEFGMDITAAFLQCNGLKYIIRSHEVPMQGYELHHSSKLVTVFSAPNYCGDIQNIGAVIRYDQPDSNKPAAIQFPPSLWYQEPPQQRGYSGWQPFDRTKFTASKRIDLPLIPKRIYRRRTAVPVVADREGKE